jgi:hypothetical protein
VTNPTDESHRGQTDADAVAYGFELQKRGYLFPCRKPGGQWVAVMPSTFGGAIICTDFRTYGHERAYSYASILDAVIAVYDPAWDGLTDPPGPWIRAYTSDGLRYREPRPHELEP